MFRYQTRYYLKLLLLLAISLVISPVAAHASTSSSTNYELSEAEFGSGNSSDACSSKYCSQSSIGRATSDGFISGSQSASFSEISPDSEPLLEVIVEEGVSDLGVLSTDKTAYKTSVIKVRSYLSGGYTLSVYGDTPKHEGHHLKTSDSLFSSKPGNEQFGINLTNNSTPVVGSSPKQEPAPEFSFGQVEPDYAVANQFKYSNGDVVARSTVESGQTNYTISMIINISSSTPAGHYSSDLSSVVVPVF